MIILVYFQTLFSGSDVTYRQVSLLPKSLMLRSKRSINPLRLQREAKTLLHSLCFIQASQSQIKPYICPTAEFKAPGTMSLGTSVSEAQTSLADRCLCFCFPKRVPVSFIFFSENLVIVVVLDLHFCFLSPPSYKHRPATELNVQLCFI